MRWLSRHRLYADLAEEMRDHLQQKVDELVESGLSPEDAALAARRAFGNPTLLEERSRDVWRWPFVDTALLDVRSGLRLTFPRAGRRGSTRSSRYGPSSS